MALDLWTDPYEGKVGVGQVSSSLDLKTVKNAVNGSELGKYIIEVLFFFKKALMLSKLSTSTIAIL